MRQLIPQCQGRIQPDHFRRLLGGRTAPRRRIDGIGLRHGPSHAGHDHRFHHLADDDALQDLTAALVKQIKIPYEYAFMFTAALRFVPDFIAESQAVQEAQACRGLSTKGNVFKKVINYMSVVQPLMLKSLGRSETMALSLELRGFGSHEHSFMSNVQPKGRDYIVIFVMLALSCGIVYLRMQGMV